jgi:NADH dehydrogenase (ubiquinone) Fe-S protein 1
MSVGNLPLTFFLTCNSAPRRALSEHVGTPLPYDDVLALRDRMWDISPTLVRYENIEPTSIDVTKLGLSQLSSVKSQATSSTPLTKPIKDFYMTNPIARASVTMAACSKAFVKQDYALPNVDSKQSQVSGQARGAGGAGNLSRN